MTMNVGRQIAELRRMTVTQLRQKHIEAFGESTRSGHKDYLVKRIAWRLQAQDAGDLSERARRRAEQLANDADLRTTAPKHPTDDTAPGFTTRAATLPPSDREQIVALSRELVDAGEVGEACSLFDALWDALTAREQARILHLLIERIDYDGVNGTVSITFHPTGIKTLADELAQQEATA